MGESWICDNRLFLPPILPKLARDLPDPLSELRLRSSALLPLRSPTYACPFVLFFLCQKLPLLLSLSYAKSCFFLFSCIQTKGNNQCFSYSKDCLSFFLVKHALKHYFSLFVIGQTLGWSRLDLCLDQQNWRKRMRRLNDEDEEAEHVQWYEWWTHRQGWRRQDCSPPHPCLSWPCRCTCSPPECPAPATTRSVRLFSGLSQVIQIAIYG